MTRTFNREISNRYLLSVQRGFQFPLTETTRDLEGDEAANDPERVIVARVQKLTLAKLATLTGLSQTMQSAVMAVFEELDRANQDIPSLRDPWDTFVENVHKQNDLVNGTCIAGFLEPRLTETQADADAANDPNIVWVESIAYKDRERYLDTIMRPEGEAAKALAPFPDERLEDSPTRETVSVAPTPERAFTTLDRAGV